MIKKIFNTKYNSNKFYFIVFSFILTSFTISSALQPKDLNSVSSTVESQYTNFICEGGDSIIKAGCAIIGGQVVRAVPAIIFGASFDKMYGCLQKYNDIKPGSKITISGNDTCSQLGYFNPNLDKKNYTFVFEEGISSDPSLFGMIDQASSVNTLLMRNSFDTSYYASKSIENIPYVKTAFAQQTQTRIYGYGGKQLQDLMFSVWQSTRNFAFILLGALSIVLGITLMSSNSFMDNNAKWRISLEQALPKVIIAVLLIQASYTFGDIMLGIADNESFRPLISYVLNNGQESVGEFWVNFALTQSIVFLVIAVLAMFVLGTTGVGLSVIVILLLVGIIAVYRMIILLYLNFSAILGIVLLTLASPLIIAMSLLPGEAGGNQLRRYFASIISLTSQTFLYQAIKSGTIFLAGYIINGWFLNGSFLEVLTIPVVGAGAAVGTSILLLVIFLPVLITLIYGYADRVVGISDQFARSLVGADPIGSANNNRN